MVEETSEYKIIEDLQILLSDGEEEALQIFLRLVRPEDIAELFDVLSGDDRQRIVEALDADAAGTVLTDTTSPIRALLVDEIEPERLARIAEAIPPDDAADLIGDLEIGETEEVLRHISSTDEQVLRHLLTYPDDTAGGIMHPDPVALKPDATVDDAVLLLRTADHDTPIGALYVIDGDPAFVVRPDLRLSRGGTLQSDVGLHRRDHGHGRQYLSAIVHDHGTPVGPRHSSPFSVATGMLLILS